MFLKRTRKIKNIDKKEQLIKLVASFIFLTGAFMYIGRIAYNYYVELRDYNKAQEFLNIGKEEVFIHLIGFIILKYIYQVKHYLSMIKGIN